MEILKMPKFMDFGQPAGWMQALRLEQCSHDMGHKAFNSSVEIGILIYYLKQKFNIDLAIETGTDGGATSIFFARYFNEVHTIEIDQERFKNASKNLSRFDNVKCYLGNSDSVLEEILPTLVEKKALFYLDGHCDSNVEAYWPLINELEVISKTHHDNCIICIDDFKVPGRVDIPFDRINGNDCSFEYIKSQIKKIYSKYSLHYLIPANKEYRAKVLVMPNA
jgi:predicted O-methyltransferase YrrM